MTDLSHRQYMAAVATAVAARWDNEKHDIGNADEWEPMDGVPYEIRQFTPSALMTIRDRTVAGWLIEDDKLAEQTMEVFYNPSAVHLTFESKSDELRACGLAELTTEQTRKIAAALFQAAEELDRRREVEYED